MIAQQSNRFINLRQASFPSALALLTMLSGVAFAEEGSAIKVDRIYRTDEYVTVVMRVKNSSPDPVEALRISCDVFAADGSALGVAGAKAENVPGGATVIGEAVGRMPPKDIPAASAQCRLIDGY